MSTVEQKEQVTPPVAPSGEVATPPATTPKPRELVLGGKMPKTCNISANKTGRVTRLKVGNREGIILWNIHEDKTTDPAGNTIVTDTRTTEVTVLVDEGPDTEYYLCFFGFGRGAQKAALLAVMDCEKESEALSRLIVLYRKGKLTDSQFCTLMKFTG